MPPYREPDGQECYWSRGNGWVYAALVRTLQTVGKRHKYYKELKADFLTMTRAIAACQRQDGLWNVSMTSTHYAGPELTGTALFLYGLSWGISQGLIKAKTYRPVADRAWQGMERICLHPDGFLGYVQGTGKQPSDGQPVSYTSVPDFEDFGTGCFLLMNCGEKPIFSHNNLVTTVAWKIGNKVNYALEGSIFVGGSVVQWLRDGLGIIRSSAEVESLAASVPDTGGVCFVPALTGLAAPWWDQYARGTLTGISRGTTAAHIARAALEGIAFQTLDIVDAMSRDSGLALRELKVDGGASRNNLLMQFQSDILRAKVIRPAITETTALGAAYLAGIAVGYWSGIDEIRNQWRVDAAFEPTMGASDVATRVEAWHDAVRRTLSNYTK